MRTFLITIISVLSLFACANRITPEPVTILTPVTVEVYPELPPIEPYPIKIDNFKFNETNSDQVFVTLSKDNLDLLLVTLAKASELSIEYKNLVERENNRREEWSIKNIQATEKLEEQSNE